MKTFCSVLVVGLFSTAILNVGFSQQADFAENTWTRNVGEDWRGFLGPTADGKSTEKGILKDWSKNKLNLVWKAETGEGYGIGTFHLGRYFHFDRDGNDARLRCLNAETGKLMWQYRYPSKYRDLYGYDSGPRASPIADGNFVYLYGVEGMLTCVDIRNGKKVWAVDTAERFDVVQNFFGVGSSPVVVGDKLLVMVGGSTSKERVLRPQLMRSVKPNGSLLVALDKRDGKVLYQSGDDLASYSTPKVTKIAGQELALVWGRESLHGFKVDDGTQVFEFPWRARILESVNASSPVVKGSNILLTECYGPGSVMLNFENGDVDSVWSDEDRRGKAMAAHWNTPVQIGEHGYGSSGRNAGDAKLKCFEWATGKVLWEEKGWGRASITMIDGHLVILGEYGRLGLAKATPKGFELVTEWESEKQKLSYPCWAAPVISHGLMVVRGKKEVLCFDLIPERE